MLALREIKAHCKLNNTGSESKDEIYNEVYETIKKGYERRIINS